MVGPGWLADTRASYDTVAASYADQVRGLHIEQARHVCETTVVRDAWAPAT